MRREEVRINKYCLKKSNQVSVEEAEDKKSTDKTKASEVIQEVFEKCDESKIIFVEETVDKKFSDNMKASEVLEKVLVKCDNCGENFKTTQGLIKFIRIYQKVINRGVTNVITKNINEKGLKQHQRMKV